VIIGLGQQAPAPSAVERDSLYTSADSMRVMWEAPIEYSLTIIGYVLESDDGLLGSF
jgi:hypothetical protein